MRIEVEVPDQLGTALGDHMEQIRARVGEALVIYLWQGGEMSTRVAAECLQMSYQDYLHFLASRNVAVAASPAPA